MGGVEKRSICLIIETQVWPETETERGLKRIQMLFKHNWGGERICLKSSATSKRTFLLAKLKLTRVARQRKKIILKNNTGPLAKLNNGMQSLC